MSCGNVPEGQTANEDGEEVLMPRRKEIRRTDRSICQRCRKTRSLYITRSTTYCQQCFLASISSNFLKILYPPLRSSNAPKGMKQQAMLNRPPIQSGNVLVPISGGSGSMTMLDLLVSGGYIGRGDGYRADKTKGERDVVWEKGYVLYVEFGSVTGMKDRSEELRAYVDGLGSGLEVVTVKAEDIFDADHPGLAADLSHPELPISNASSSKTPLEQLQHLLISVPHASRPSILSNILTHMIERTAASLPNISHILLGETSTREAQRLISGTAMGRGWALPLELAPSRILDVRGREITRIKPMKEITVKDSAIYCKLKGIPMINQREWGTGVSNKGKAVTLEALTEQFIASLTVTHPATVSTIIKTGDKLKFAGDIASERCPFCDEPVDDSALEWKSKTALTALPGKSGLLDSISNGEHKGESLASRLCYACLTTLTPDTSKHDKDQSRTVQMPPWMDQYMISD